MDRNLDKMMYPGPQGHFDAWKKGTAVICSSICREEKERTGIKKNALYHFGYDIDYLIIIMKIYL